MSNSLVVATPLPEIESYPVTQDNSSIRRTHFPDTFIFGSGTAAFQVEGAAALGGKGPSLWDDLTRSTPAKIADGSNGNVACDMYHRYEEDIVRMKNMGFDGYRFSIAWPRILPTGRTNGGINQEGIDYYNKVIDCVLKHGMKPYVTLFHWDTPIWLEKEYGGFLSKKIVEDYRDYVEICFWEFGDRVKWWTTLNEPWTYAANGYVDGFFLPDNVSIPIHRDQSDSKPPSRFCFNHLEKSAPKTRTYSEFVKYDPAKGPYYVGKHLLLAHAAAVHLYRDKFQEVQQGQIGIVCNSHWHVPFDENKEEDVAAAKRGVDFMLGWFLEPVLYGRYPKTMTDFIAPENLAHLSQKESEMIKGTIDFLGLNYYTTNYAQHDPKPEGVGYHADMKLKYLTEKTVGGKTVPIGDATGSSWMFAVPWGIYEHLVYLKKTYSTDLPPIYITENGVAEKNNFKLTAKEACVDPLRVKFHQDHLAYLLKAITVDKVDVRGYFAWAYCDNFEWPEGYSSRFGLVYVDYVNHLTRYPKDSAKWFIKFLKGPKVLAASKKRPAVEEVGSENGGKKARAIAAKQ